MQTFRKDGNWIIPILNYRDGSDVITSSLICSIRECLAAHITEIGPTHTKIEVWADKETCEVGNFYFATAEDNAEFRAWFEKQVLSWRPDYSKETENE